MTPSLCPAHCGTRLVDGACPLCDAMTLPAPPPGPFDLEAATAALTSLLVAAGGEVGDG